MTVRISLISSPREAISVAISRCLDVLKALMMVVRSYCSLSPWRVRLSSSVKVRELNHY